MSRSSTHMLRLCATAAAAGFALAAAPASAQSLAVNATVTNNCTATTTAVAFDNVNVLSATADDGVGDLSVTCTNGATWHAAANAGSTTGATIATRKMASGSTTTPLSYQLYTTSARNVVWGDAADANSVKLTGTGTGSAVANPIYGRIPTGQNTVKAGSYTDTVTVTLTF